MSGWDAINAWLIVHSSRRKVTIECSTWFHLTLTENSGDGASNTLFQGPKWSIVLDSAADWCRAEIEK